MRSSVAVLAVLALLVGPIAGCGGDDDDSGGVTPAKTTSQTTPGGAVVVSYNCPKGDIYSAGAGGCIAEGEGKNPCPEGEVPAGDQPACFPKAKQ